jgi:hypothetical protein
MFCGPRALGTGWQGGWHAAQNMSRILRFYEDQCYNPHANEYHAIYLAVIPRWKVFGSLTGRGSRPVGCFLARHDCRWWQMPRPAGWSQRASAYHQIHVLASTPRSWYEDTLKVRCRFFKVIRLHMCKNWLALVRMVIGKGHWCDEVVAGIVQKQLEAWFATVPHKDVRWSIYAAESRYYRVAWWND